MEATIVATWKFVDIHEKTCEMNTIIIVQCTCTIKGKMKRCKDCLSTKLEHSKFPVYDMLYMCMNFHLPTTIKGMDARAPIRTIIMSHSTEKHPRQTASST